MTTTPGLTARNLSGVSSLEEEVRRDGREEERKRARREKTVRLGCLTVGGYSSPGTCSPAHAPALSNDAGGEYLTS